MKKIMPLKILVTAGPTREYLDPIRFISNESSGRIGFALAQAAQELGHEVGLITGPVALETPKGVKRLDIVSCAELRQATHHHAQDADVIIMTAAVADARPWQKSKHKLKKPLAHVRLRDNPDILVELGKNKRPGQILVGFALETQHLIATAKKKRINKNCDWIVGNTHHAIGAKESAAILIGPDGKSKRLPMLPKHDLAVVILSHILG